MLVDELRCAKSAAKLGDSIEVGFISKVLDIAGIIVADDDGSLTLE
jgi:hypothetical protein